MRADRRKVRVAVSVVAAALLAGGAQPQVWGDVTKANNTDALNLGSSYTGNAPPSAAEKINFDATITGPLAYPLGGDLTVNGLNFTTFVGAQTITATPGATLTLGAGGITSTNITDNITIGADLKLSASQTFAVPDNRTLTLGGAITSGAGVTLSVGAAPTTVNAVYLLNAAATYTGGTKILQGTFKMGVANALPAGTLVTIGGASGTAKLGLTGNALTIAGLEEAGGGTRQVINGIAGVAPILTINVPAGVSHDYGSALGASGNANNNNFGLTKIGDGLQEFSNANNVFLTGAVTISAGALGIRPANGTGTGPGYNMVLDGGVFQSNTAASTFTRPLGTAAGQLQMTANGGGFSGKGGTLTVNLGGALAAVDWLGAPGAGLVGPLKFGHASSTFDVVFQNPINLNGAVRTVNVDENGSSVGDFTTLAGAIADGSGPGGITKTGPGLLVLGATNTYTGGTTVNAGILVAATTTSIPVGTTTVAGGAAITARTTNFTTAAQIDAARNAISFSPGAGFGFDVPFATTFTPPAQITGAEVLYKSGLGDLILPTANTHTGGTTIYNGRVLIGDNAALGTTGTLTLNFNSTLSSTDTNARTVAVPVTITGATSLGGTGATETGALTFSSAISLNGAGRNITVNAPTTFAAGFTNGALVKLGTSTLTLQGTSTNTGVTEDRDGTLILAAGATLNATDGLRVMETVNNLTARTDVIGTYNIATTTGNIRVGHDNSSATGATNILDIHGTLGFTSLTSGGATQLGSSSLFATVNMYPGSLLVTKQIANSTANFVAGTTTTINIDGGTIRALDSRTNYMTGLTGGAFLRAGGVTFDTNGFDITIGQSIQHDAALGATPDGGLKKTGAGILALTGTTNNYTGDTTVLAGTLQVNTTNGTGTGAVLVKNGGTLGGTGSIAGPITLEAGAKVAPGASAGTLTVGTLTLDAAVNGTGAGALVFEIGSTSDKIAGTSITYGAGQLDLDDFTFSSLAGIAPGNYTLMTGVTAGSLGPNTSASNVAGLSGYDAQLSQNSGSVVLTLTGVPEPGTIGVIGAAVIGLLGRRRRALGNRAGRPRQ